MLTQVASASPMSRPACRAVLAAGMLPSRASVTSSREPATSSRCARGPAVIAAALAMASRQPVLPHRHAASPPWGALQARVRRHRALGLARRAGGSRGPTPGTPVRRRGPRDCRARPATVVGTTHGTGGVNAGLFGALVVRRRSDPLPDHTSVTAFGDQMAINLRRYPDTDTYDPQNPQVSLTSFVARQGSGSSSSRSGSATTRTPGTCTATRGRTPVPGCWRTSRGRTPSLSSTTRPSGPVTASASR